VALAVALAVGLVAGGTAAATSAGAAVADPIPPASAPAVVDTYSPYLPQNSCDPVVKPGTAALRATLLATYGGRDLGITRGCAIGALSEHKEGRAFDWGLNSADPAELAIATQFLTWLLAPGPAGEPGYNAKRLGVMYIIWNGKIWGGYRAADGWRAYSGGEAHAGHIHLSLSWNGATKRSSWWTGTAAPTDYGPCAAIQGEMAPRWKAPRLNPCPAPTPIMSLTGSPLLGLNATSPYVKQLQMRLKVSPASGFFGPVTDAALRAFQTSHGLPVTGTTTAATWAALRNPATTPTLPPPPPPTTIPQTPPNHPAAKARPKLLSRMTYRVRRGDTVGHIATVWRSNVRAIVSVNHLRGTSIRRGQVLSVPVRSWLTRYSHTTIRKGNHNRTVRALQTGLRMPTRYRTSVFGTITATYVNRVKARYGWARDGVAGPGVWRKLGA
jgi:peptidoglycan hydrolase-like protein with peptidoglycan-binding domain